MAQSLFLSPKAATSHFHLPARTGRLPARTGARILRSPVAALALSLRRGSVHALAITRTSFRSHSSIRCEQGAKETKGLDVWLSRAAMLGFAGAVTVELTTGKGVLENLGFTAPLPTLALALTGVVGVVTAFLIFQSASQD